MSGLTVQQVDAAIKKLRASGNEVLIASLNNGHIPLEPEHFSELIDVNLRCCALIVCHMAPGFLVSKGKWHLFF